MTLFPLFSSGSGVLIMRICDFLMVTALHFLPSYGTISLYNFVCGAGFGRRSGDITRRRTNPETIGGHKA